MTAGKRTPKKPTTTLGHVTFTNKSPPKVTIENLPIEKEILESKIIEKFVRAMKTFTDRDIGILGRGKDPPDFDASEGGTRFGIELVEVKHFENAAKMSLRKKYLAKIQEGISIYEADLSGIQITLNDGYQHVMYPPWNSRPGERDAIIRMFIDGFKKNLMDMANLRLGEARAFKWGPGPKGEILGAAAQRFAPKSTSQTCSIVFSGGLPESVGEILTALSVTIEKKRKMYERLDFSYPLMLVAYETDFSRFENNESPCVILAREQLEKRHNPFNEVWYFSPAAAELPGRIEKVWP